MGAGGKRRYKAAERMYLAIKGDEIYGPSDLLGLEKLLA